jgi:hypothetical protein
MLPFLAFCFLGWFGAKLISMGLEGIRLRTLAVGFGWRIQGRPALIVATVLLVLGLITIAPFLWFMARFVGIFLGPRAT